MLSIIKSDDIIDKITIASALGIAILTTIQIIKSTKESTNTSSSPPQNKTTSNIVEQYHLPNSTRIINRIHHGDKTKSELPSKAAPDPPYSKDIHRLYEVLHQIGSDVKRRKATRHHRISCAHCDRTVLGTRYLCTECLDQTICQACERANCHDSHHILYKLDNYVPPQLEAESLWSGQPPWSSSNRDIFQRPLLYNEIEQLKDQASNYAASSSEIEALYDQFLCFVDMEDDEHEDPAISRKTFLDLLPTSLYALKVQQQNPTSDNDDVTSPKNIDYLSQFFLNYYDRKNKGYITFAEYALGVFLLLDNRNLTKAYEVLSLCPDGVDLKDHLRRLIFAYSALSKHAFRDALNIKRFGKKTFEEHIKDINQHSHEEGNKINKDNVNSIRHRDLMMETQRKELSSLSTFDPSICDPRTDLELDMLRDIDVEMFLSDLFQGDRSESSVDIAKELALRPDCVAVVAAIMEAGIP